MNFRKVSELYNKHKSERAWIFGKGPSLDLYSREKIGSLRICINESLWQVDWPTYFFAHDELPIKRVAPDLPNGCTAILQHERAIFAVQCGVPPEQIRVYKKAKTPSGPTRMALHDNQAYELAGWTNRNRTFGNSFLQAYWGE